MTSIYMYLYGKKWSYWGYRKWYIIILYIKICSCNLIFECMHLKHTNTWIAIIKFGGHHASKSGIIYCNGGHIAFNYTHTSLTNYNSTPIWCIIYLFYYIKVWDNMDTDPVYSNSKNIYINVFLQILLAINKSLFLC